jgi:nucleotide-binding universal stress UspA family protein
MVADGELDVVVLCTDGSDEALVALRAGLRILGSVRRHVVVTVIDPVDPALAVGGGHAGPVLTPTEVESIEQRRHADAHTVVDDTAAALGLDDAEREVLLGAPGPAICDHAEQIGAAAIVLGTRGRGGIRRAVLGSVSDHVVRNAACPVVTVRPSP